MGKKKIIIALNSAWNLYNFRAGLIKALVKEGYEVVAVAPWDKYALLLPALGCQFKPLEMDTTGKNPAGDLRVLIDYIRLLRKERPAAFLGFTIKPNVYGSLAAGILGIPVINNIAGLGFAFTKKNWLTKVVISLYRLALRRSAMVYFQNEEDRRVFLEKGLVHQARSRRIPGSGVDVNRFMSCQPPTLGVGQTFRFLLAARLLWEKGVAEYVDAARQLQKTHPHVECCIVGFTAENHAQSVSRAQVEEWHSEGVIHYLGVTDRIEDVLEAAHCVVLPSYYREGVPRVLLEAAAAGRPIVTTDWIGCREVVSDGLNGLLCSPRDTDDLLSKMTTMLQLPAERRMEMGQRGRDKVTQEFSEEAVIKNYIDLLQQVTEPGGAPRT